VSHPGGAYRIMDETSRAPTYDELVAANAAQAARIAELEAEVARLSELVEKATRAGKRQAAPFAKPIEPKPRKPGRKKGQGRHGHRAVPTRIDREVDVPLPERCPHCDHDRLVTDRVADQYQSDIPPVEPVVTKFCVHVGHCTGCGKRVQGHHPDQVSDALGAAGVVLGPRVVALIVWANKTLGLSHGKVRALLCLFGIDVTRGAVTHAIVRAGRRSQPTYDELKTAIRGSPAVVPDETGWRIGGLGAWLWVFATATISLYAIHTGRGFAQATETLPADWSGTLTRDGWAPYRRYKSATHQTCVAHLLRRCRELRAKLPPSLHALPAELAGILHDALALRDARADLRDDTVIERITGLESRLDGFVRRRPRNKDLARLVKHVRTERAAILTFLHQPGIDAANWRAEQAIRPAVVNRKVWGGNRTRTGADAQQTLMSILHTATKQGHDPIAVMTAILLGQPTPLTP
jgi:transposase